MRYKIIILQRAEKEIKKIPKDIGKKIIRRIYELGEDPRPLGCKKLTDYQSSRTSEKVCYRLRQGDYRIIYTIEEGLITITVVQVSHRKEVYKK